MKKRRFLLFDLFRLFAITLVLCYHFGPQKVSGGLIGVDLLATLSGFLITGLFLDATMNRSPSTKPETLFSFWKRRFRRILPTLFLLVFFILPVTFLFSSDFRVGLMRQAAAALGFVTNLFEMATGGSYESRFVKHLFLHTWTLSIEMHFYLFWGIVLFLCRFWNDRLHAADAPRRKEERLRGRILVISGILWLISLLFMVIGTMRGKDTTRLYFSDASRAFPYFAGAFCASLLGMQKPTMFLQFLRRRMTPFVLGLLSLGTILGIVAMAKVGRYEDRSLYAWMLPLLSVLTVVLLGSLRLLHAKYRFPESQRLHRVANGSYGLYLFHWPFFVLLESTFSKPIAVVGAMLLAILFTVFSDRFVHRMWEKTRWTPPQCLAVHLALGALLCSGFLAEEMAPRLVSLEQNLWQESLKQGFEQANEKAIRLKQELDAAEEKKAQQASVRKAGITIIGDSVTLGVREALLAHFENATVDAKVSRFLHEAPDILQEKENDGKLRPTVIIALGANIYPNYQETVQRLLTLLPEGGRLILVTPATAVAKEGDDITGYIDYLREIDGTIPYLTIADWERITKAHSEIFKGTDGTHFMGNEEGTSLFLQMLDDAISASAEKPGKGE